MIWHSNTVTDVLEELGVNPDDGLSEHEAAERLKEYGKNSLQDQHALSFCTILTRQLRHPFTAALLAVSGCTLVLDLYKQILQNAPTDWEQSLLVAGITIGGVVIGSLWRYYTRNAITKLHVLSSPEARVRRNGKEQLLAVHLLVPGDIVLLDVGDIVPADCRLIDAIGLRCDERELTHATMPTKKSADDVYDDITPLAQRTNMLYAGTSITAGTATAVVVATGVRSEMGRHASQEKQPSSDSPAQKKSKTASRLWGWIVAVLCAIALVVGLVVHPDHSTVILTAMAMAMAMVPTNLSDLIAQLITHSIRRMARHKVQLRHPEIARILGEVTVVCTEQETLFKNEKILLDSAYISATTRTISLSNPLPKERGVAPFIRMAVLNSTAGHPLDDAILEMAARSGVVRDELLVDMPRIGELTPCEQRHVGVHIAGDQTLILVTGDWRSTLPLCCNDNANTLTEKATAMEADCLQVVAIAYRLDDNAPTVYTSEELEHDLICVGLLGYKIPWQGDLDHIGNTTTSIRSILFSNVSVASAVAVAEQAGFALHPKAATADMVANFSDTDWDDAVQQYDIYCNLSTAQKQQVVSALQRQGAVVAVAASRSDEIDLLSTADVSFVRGTVATDVAKNTADALLTDDSYIALVSSIIEGKYLNTLGLCIWIYMILCALVMFGIGFAGLAGWALLQRQSVLLVCLHLLLITILPSSVLLVMQNVKMK